MELQKVLFTDLDGTLIETKSGRTFPLHSEDWKFIPETLNAIKEYYSKGYKIIIVTNQGGLAFGYFSVKVFLKKMTCICNSLEKILKLRKNSVSYFFCSKMQGFNRKPFPGMAIQAMEEYHLTLHESVMMGDMDTDEEFTLNAGINTYLSIDKVKELFNAPRIQELQHTEVDTGGTTGDSTEGS
jgi:HAD superfamily hydrolase (TIGR01662 family)